MNIENIQGLIFDYGGTLDTNARHWAHVIWEGFQHAEIPVSHEQFREAYVYGERALAKAPIILPDDNFPTLMRKKLEIETTHLMEMGVWQPSSLNERRQKSDQAAQYCADYAQRNIERSHKVLTQLANRYPMVLVSNFYGNIGTILKDYHLDSFFPHVIESAVVGVRKPDPAIYQMGVDALQLPAEKTAVIGDSFGKDMVPAKAIGCKAIWMKGEGWNSDEQNDETLPDAIIYDINEITEILK